MKWAIIAVFWIKVSFCHEDTLELFVKTRARYLQKFEGYDDVNINHVDIPHNIPFAAFKFTAAETQMSIFGCTPRDVEIYVKQRSLPVVNADRSRLPPDFKNISRLELHHLKIRTDNKTVEYVNFTSPQPGCYFIATFLPYSDSKHDSIQPSEFRPNCHAYVNVAVYVKRRIYPEMVNDGDLVKVDIITNEDSYFKFFVPDLVSHARLNLSNVTFAQNMENLTISVQQNSFPSQNNTLMSYVVDTDADMAQFSVPFQTASNNFHVLQFSSRGVPVNENNKSSFYFKVNFVYYTQAQENYDEKDNRTEISKTFFSNLINLTVPYREFSLARISISDIAPINLTGSDFVVIKFELFGHSDIGGVLQFSLAFKPEIDVGKMKIKRQPENHTVIGCFRPDFPEFPSWPNFCDYGEEHNVAPLLLNKSVDNSSIMLPFPESGVWYGSIKLFCGECIPCKCPNKCQKEFESCVNDCEVNCLDQRLCHSCAPNCKEEVADREGCESCDCDGSCLRDKSNTCNSSIIFDVSSVSCANNCGKNGRCLFTVSDGIVYASCVCFNNYRGWDCSDDSHTTPYYLVLLELLLLVLSNFMFLPAVFVAYHRKYYVEAVCFFSIFFFSTFYHACDAGENILSYCLVRMAALQFGDFFCALLAIWVTLLAIADLPSTWTSIAQIAGAIVLSFLTTINKTSLWFLTIPAIVGMLIIAGSWTLKYRKVKQRFVNRNYLYFYIPIGSAIVTIGLIIFAFFETAYNYKYLHSLWHIIMAVAAMLLLPRQDTFQPESML